MMIATGHRKRHGNRMPLLMTTDIKLKMSIIAVHFVPAPFGGRLGRGLPNYAQAQLEHIKAVSVKRMRPFTLNLPPVDTGACVTIHSQNTQQNFSLRRSDNTHVR